MEQKEVSLYLEISRYKRLEQLAKDNNISISELIRSILDRYLKQKNAVRDFLKKVDEGRLDL